MEPSEIIEWGSAPTSEQRATDKLRDTILNGVLPVGEFLSQRKLAELAGSSVISVRGALRNLENEGLLENVPRMGVRIPVETPKAVRERYLVRKALESAAVEQTCGNLSDGAANRLLDLAAKLDHLAAGQTEGTYLEFARLHLEFHLLIAENTGSPLLVQMIRRVINPSLMLLNAVRSWEHPSELHQNHTALAQVIIGGDTRAAIREMQTHIQIGLESEIASL